MKGSHIMKRYLQLLPLIILSACASPAAQMTPEQVSNLSNQQLCELTWNYPYEQKTQVEIGKRKINCDPVYIECDNSGVKPGTPGFMLCMKNVQERNELAQQAQTQAQPNIGNMLWDMQARRQKQQEYDLQNQRQQMMNEAMRKQIQRR
jgi:hypothetical protein